MECKNCKCPAVRNGKQPNGKQRYYCKDCKKSFQECYAYKAYNCDTNRYIYYLTIESVGIRSISRLLRVSKTTVINRIKLMSSKISIPITKERNQYYELDEMRVIVKHKSREAWITYAINRDSKRVIDFIVGRRTKSNLAIISNSVLKLNPKTVYTDQLPAYKSLIPLEKHNNQKSNTMIIERNNLTLRTRLKRLSRKTICFSKNFEMLRAVLKIYLWGYQLKF